MVDRSELRLAAILEAIAQTHRDRPLIRVKGVDLEELYREITH